MFSTLRPYCLIMLAGAVGASAQPTSYPYVVKTVAGSFPLGDGGPAASALLYNPYAAVPDGAGSLYILDSAAGFNAIRKVTPDGKISTLTMVVGYYDMKLG